LTFLLKEDENIASGIWISTLWLVWLLTVSVGGWKPSEQITTNVEVQMWINMRHIPHELFRNNSLHESWGKGSTKLFVNGHINTWLEVSIWKVLRPAISTQDFLGFPVSISKCWDGSQDSKLPLHASHVALPSKFSSSKFHVVYM
jgi:hypothetical protein